MLLNEAFSEPGTGCPQKKRDSCLKAIQDELRQNFGEFLKIQELSSLTSIYHLLQLQVAVVGCGCQSV